MVEKNNVQELLEYLLVIFVSAALALISWLAIRIVHDIYMSYNVWREGYVIGKYYDLFFVCIIWLACFIGIRCYWQKKNFYPK
jgi:H+/Cl- antiporter ClcA